MATFDKKNNLWRSLNHHPYNNGEISPGQRILDVLSTHGSKIAQVFLNSIIKSPRKSTNSLFNIISIR